MSADSMRAIEVFCSYAHKDEKWRNELESQLSNLKRQGLITSWHDRNISAGTDWAGEIDAHLNRASIILLLISPDFIASDYCYGVEMKRAMERFEAGESYVIPIILRPTYWKGTPFARLQVLPVDGKPVTSWRNHDKAFLEIAKGIRKAVEELCFTKEEDIAVLRQQYCNVWIEQPAQFDTHAPAPFVFALLAHLSGTAALTDRKEQFNGIPIDDGKETGLSQESTKPVLMGLQLPLQSRAIGQACKQVIVIALEPAVKGAKMA